MRKARVKRPRTRPGDRHVLCHVPEPCASTAPESGKVVHSPRSLTSAAVKRFLTATLLFLLLPAPASAVDVVGDDVADEYVISGATYLDGSALAAPEAATCVGCHWRVVRICDAGSLDDRRGCEQLPISCASDVAEVWRADGEVQPPIGDPAWEYRGLMCLRHPPVSVVIADVAITDLVRQAVPALRPGSAPHSYTLTNLHTAFFSGQPIGADPVASVAGALVQLHLRPQWTWDFGHGPTLTTTHPGDATRYSAVRHRYPKRGIYRVNVLCTWSATYEVNGIGGNTVPQPVQQTAWFDLRVKEARRYLVHQRSTP